MTQLTGTLPLLRLAARRDRMLIGVSAVALIVLAVASAEASLALYPTPESLQHSAAGLLANPSLLAMYGPIADPTSPDAFAVFKTVLMGAVFLGILCATIVRRHTRGDEEEGRLELVGAGAVGRQAPLAAGVVLALAVTVATSLLAAGGLIVLGMGVGGSLAFATGWIVAGLFMTGVAALAAQLTTTARAAGGIAWSVLLATFILRAVGDTGSGPAVLGWISPLGWVVKISAYGADRFWVLGLGVLWLAGCLGAAFVLLEKRDLGAGLLPTRPGPATGGPLLVGPLGLAWRLQRPSVLAWTVAVAVLGLAVGSLARSANDLLDDPAVADLLATMGGSHGSLMDIFFATELKFAAAAAAVAGVATLLRLRTEEISGRAEPLLAGGVTRRRWMSAYAVSALALPTWLMLVLGLSAGVAAQSAPGAPSVLALTGAALATLPAVWVVVGLGLVLVGALPRWAGATWAVLAAAYGLGEFGAVMGLPSWLLRLTPVTHLSQLPGGVLDPGPLLVMTTGAILAACLGLLAFQRRDVPA